LKENLLQFNSCMPFMLTDRPQTAAKWQTSTWRRHSGQQFIIHSKNNREIELQIEMQRNFSICISTPYSISLRVRHEMPHIQLDLLQKCVCIFSMRLSSGQIQQQNLAIAAVPAPSLHTLPTCSGRAAIGYVDVYVDVL